MVVSQTNVPHIACMYLIKADQQLKRQKIDETAQQTQAFDSQCVSLVGHCSQQSVYVPLLFYVQHALGFRA